MLTTVMERQPGNIRRGGRPRSKAWEYVEDDIKMLIGKVTFIVFWTGCSFTSISFHIFWFIGLQSRF